MNSPVQLQYAGETDTVQRHAACCIQFIEAFYVGRTDIDDPKTTFSVDVSVKSSSE